MAEWRSLITEWLGEFANLQQNEIKSFAAEHEHNHEIATAIYNLFCGDEENSANCNCDSQSQTDQVYSHKST